MEILKRDEIILMYSLTKAAGLSYYIITFCILIKLLLYHICEAPWAYTQEIIVKKYSGKIRLF